MNTFSHKLRNKVLAIAVALIAVAAVQPAAFAQLQPLPMPQFTLIHSFNGGDGFGPMAGVIQGADGALYGTTSSGGGGLTMGLGTVFRLDRTTLGLTTLHTFGFGDGLGLYAGVALGRDGLLYGSTTLSRSSVPMLRAMLRRRLRSASLCRSDLAVVSGTLIPYKSAFPVSMTSQKL